MRRLDQSFQQEILEQKYSQYREEYKKENYHNVIELITKLLDNESEITDKIILGRFYALNGGAHCKLGQLEAAQQSHLKALELWTSMKNNDLMDNANVNLIVVEIEKAKLVYDPSEAELLFEAILSNINNHLAKQPTSSVKSNLHCLAMVCCKLLGNSEFANDHLNQANILARDDLNRLLIFSLKAGETDKLIRLRMNDRNGRWALFMEQKQQGSRLEL
jgi:tetratricopeptide (TPR) repeat protein